MEFDLAPGFYSLDKLFPHLYEALEFHWITVNRALTAVLSPLKVSGSLICTVGVLVAGAIVTGVGATGCFRCSSLALVLVVWVVLLYCWFLLHWCLFRICYCWDQLCFLVQS